jgi:hypothetical protein
MKSLLVSTMILAGACAVAAPAFTQPAIPPTAASTDAASAPAQAPTVASQPVPDGQGSPGIPENHAVDPAPNAPGPYVGAGKQGFYDVDARISAMQQKVGALPASQRRRAGAAIKAIVAEENTQKARHGGELRDWDRESLTDKLDKLSKTYPGLAS